MVLNLEVFLNFIIGLKGGIIRVKTCLFRKFNLIAGAEVWLWLLEINGATPSSF